MLGRSFCRAARPLNAITKTTRRFASINQFNVFDGVNASDHQLPAIQKCHSDGFTVAQIRFRGALALLHGGIFLWDVGTTSARELSEQALAVFQCVAPAPEVVVIGTGRDYQPLPANVLKFFSNLGVQVEAMPSRKACSTFNILAEEGRHVAALLMPVTPTVSAREPYMVSDKKLLPLSQSK